MKDHNGGTGRAIRRASCSMSSTRFLGSGRHPFHLDSCSTPELQLDLSDAEDGDNSSNGKIYIILCRISYTIHNICAWGKNFWG